MLEQGSYPNQKCINFLKYKFRQCKNLKKVEAARIVRFYLNNYRIASDFLKKHHYPTQFYFIFGHDPLESVLYRTFSIITEHHVDQL